jgi:hypothetical protein
VGRDSRPCTRPVLAVSALAAASGLAADGRGRTADDDRRLAARPNPRADTDTRIPLLRTGPDLRQRGREMALLPQPAADTAVAVHRSL